MALVATAGLDHVDRGEPLPAVSTLSTAGLDYADRGEPLIVISASAATSVTVTPSLQSLTLTLQAPTVSADRSVTATPALQSLTLTLQAVTISAIRNPTTAPALLTLTSTLQTPTVSTSNVVTVTPSLLTVTASILAPTISATQTATVTPALLSLAVSQLAAAVSTTRGVTATPPLLTATVSLLSATVSTVGADGLDYFHRGEPLGVKVVTATARFDYFHRGEPLATVGRVPAVSVTISPAQLALTLSVHAPAVSTTSTTADAFDYFSAGEATGVKVSANSRGFDYFAAGEPLGLVARSTTGHIVATVAQLTATVSILAPSISAQRIVTVSPAQLTATLALLTPSAVVGVVGVAPALLTLTLTLHAPTVTPFQISRPVADISAGGWTTGTGATTGLYTAIDEVTALDADYIIAPAAMPTEAVASFRLGPMTDPGVSTSHRIRFRYQKDSGSTSITLIVRLYAADATTLITEVGYPGIDAVTDGVIELSGANADAIPAADYAAGLVVAFAAVVDSGGGGFLPFL